ncbi:MAG: hypothetical protein V4606_01295 [Patescibacteria group bacterium]
MNTVTLGVYQTRAEAESAIKQLIALGIQQDDISYVYSDKKGEMTDGTTGESMAQGAVDGGTVGAVIGGIAGLVVANGILPGLGSLFVAGPLAAALGLTGAAATTVAGAATGAAAGGLIGALTNMGVQETDANMYQSYIEKGEILVAARTDNPNAREVFEKTNAREIQQYTN